MAHLVLITGGARSGKSKLAITMGESFGNRKIFVATCPVVDEEMALRIERHRKERGRGNWETIEESTDIVAALRRTSAYDVRVVDCLTLWVNNLMYKGDAEGVSVTEESMSACCAELMEACADLGGTVIFVTNEVGSAIVPENPLARSFRDLVGLCNRLIAEHADQVILTVCGLPLYLKKGCES